MTGEIRILHSVHAADIGRLINPMQCRGQIEGAIGMAFGWALTLMSHVKLKSCHSPSSPRVR